MRRKKFRTFKESRKLAHSLKLKNKIEWDIFSKSNKKPADIPYAVYTVYKNEGWKGWGDFLGTGNIRPQDYDFRSFEEARIIAKKLGFKSRKEWDEFCKSGKKPKDIPSNPSGSFKKQWRGWGDWLGSGNIASQKRIFLPFEKARKFVQSLELKNQKEWRLYSKSDEKPENIPANPARTYPNEWKSYGDWLGTGKIADQYLEYKSFLEAREFVHSLNLRNRKEWDEFCKSGKKPNGIPANLEQTYKKKGVWTSMGDFLGTGRVQNQLKEFVSFSEAKKFYQKIARENRIKNSTDWREYLKTHELPSNIPRNPAVTYSKKNILRRMKKK